jgi:hypothetical protein
MFLMSAMSLENAGEGSQAFYLEPALRAHPATHADNGLLAQTLKAQPKSRHPE